MTQMLKSPTTHTRAPSQPISGIRVGVLALIAVLWTMSGHSAGLSMARQLSNMGAPQSGLAIIEKLQADPDIRSGYWEALEKERVKILHKWEMWSEIVKRGNNLQPQLTTEFYQWLLERVIAAMLVLDRSEQARALLRDWIWGPEAKPQNLRLWQREIINSYIAEGNLRDAATALGVFLREYRQSLLGVELKQQALLLHLTKQYDKAFNTLRQSKEDPHSPLYLLSLLRANQQDPKVIIQIARQKAKSNQLNHSEKLQYLKVAFSAAAVSSLPTYQNLFLELLSSPAFNESDPLFDIDAGDQWTNWFGLARTLGNQNQLLIGKDEQWFQLARKMARMRKYHSERALYAYIAVHGAERKSRNRANELLAANLEKLPGGDYILVHLYVNAPLVVKYQNLGESVRFKIADKAFILNLPHEASRLLADLPVRKEYALLKVLQQARILLLGGMHQRGAQVLREVLKQNRQLNAKELDRLMQVVFDLQSLNRHQDALEMFEIILSKGPNEHIRRESLFWMANSLSQLGRHSEAAWHYLQSARLLGNPYDLWGETSLYHAAEALIEGGFLLDAVRIFEELLKRAKEASRRSVLLNRLQYLRLRLSQPLMEPKLEPKLEP